jgi:amino acid transporter
MSGVKNSGLLWKRILLLSCVLVLLYFVAIYLKTVFDQYGSEKFIYSLVLVASLIVGLAYILLFIARKLIEKDNSSASKRKKRRLEKYRNIVNYITPYVLVAMGYHFWEKGWVLAIIVIIVLLLDRLNELIRKNK